MSRFLLTAIAACLANAALGQSTTQPMLRLVRVQLGEAVCTLVHEDGNYRVEKVFRAKSEISTGTVDASRLQELRRILSDTNLNKITQNDIHNPLMSDSFDQLQLGIWRERGWQNLVFFTSESRKPYRESLDPLLRWFHDLQRIRSSANRDDKPTNCMPEKLISQNEDARASAPQSAIPHGAAFVFRYRSSEFFRGQLDEACTIVLPDGTYRWEQSYQVFNGKRRDRIGEGQIDEGAMTELKQVLNAPDLKDAASSDTDTWGRPAQNVMGTSVWIAREDKIQVLSFENAFNTLGNPKEVGGTNNLGYTVTTQKTLEPLKRWMKGHTDKHAPGTDSEGVGNDCYPSKTMVRAGKSAD